MRSFPYKHLDKVEIEIDGEKAFLEFIDVSRKDYGYACYEVFVAFVNPSKRRIKIGKHVHTSDNCIAPQVRKLKKLLKESK